jgi:hypothetical protein
MISSYSESSSIRTVFISKHVTDHKILENVHKDSLQIPSQINRFLYNRPNEPLKASGRPAVSRSFKVQDVRTSEQHRLDDRSSFSNFYTELDFSRHCLGKFLQDVWTTWQHVRTMSSIPKYSRFPLRARKRDTAKTVQTWT